MPFYVAKCVESFEIISFLLEKILKTSKRKSSGLILSFNLASVP